jgi:predicted TIM-barrel fold metal-dependent hydrolase
MIVDVDTHWEATSYASDEFPLAPWRDQLPGSLDMLAFGIAGDLLRALPAEDRPSAMELLPNLVRMAEERGGPIILHPLHDSSPAERVDWMDRIGIDHCLVNPGGYWQQLEFLGPDRAAGVRRCNEFLGAQLASESARLHPVAVVDYADLDGAVEELERARSLGARAFFLSTDNGRPAGGTSPGHPRWDPVWTAATRLGMIAVIHVGNTAADFTGWADIGWNVPGGAGIAGLTRLANTQRIHAAQNLLSALLYGGVFARHPTLTVMLEEMRVNWVPPFLRMLERQSVSSPALGDWPWDVAGGDMLRRNVRVTPLPGFGDVDALEVLAELPEVVVWSSDYPHQEGNADPIELYRPALDDLDADLRRAFMGGTVEDCFARMGDPL